MDLRSGFDSHTKTFRSLRPPIHLPPHHVSLNCAAHALRLRHTFRWSDPIALIDSASARKLTYSDFQAQIDSLGFYLQKVLGLSKGDTAAVLSPNSVKIPILYFSLLSIGVVVSPMNPLATTSEIFHQVQISKPVIAFAVSSAAAKLPKLHRQTVLLDSSEFDSAMTNLSAAGRVDPVKVSQSDVAAILYSSGTTGRVKGVMLTHRNLIAITTGFHAVARERESPAVILYTVPFFHVFGFFYSLKSVAVGEAVVVMERFELGKMLKAVEAFRASHIVTVPPVVLAMVKGKAAEGFDLSSVEWVGCGAAPLGKDVIAAFKSKFPSAVLAQGYGLTESTGSAAGMISPEEALRWGSAGRITSFCEAKVIDIGTGEALPPCKPGELWLRGPAIMKGYIGDSESNAGTLTRDGWLRTGDLCYIDEEGFLFVVDRLKELIKYKGYQVAPAELEQVLQSHKEIIDAAVVPYRDEEAGQVPVALVVRHPESGLKEADIIDFVASQVAPYKKVRGVIFVNSIPKSPAGKILRRELRKFSLHYLNSNM